MENLRALTAIIMTPQKIPAKTDTWQVARTLWLATCKLPQTRSQSFPVGEEGTGTRDGPHSPRLFQFPHQQETIGMESLVYQSLSRTRVQNAWFNFTRFKNNTDIHVERPIKCELRYICLHEERNAN